VTVKVDAFFRNTPQFREGKDLESAAVCQDRTVPAHELVQIATLLDHFQTGPQKEVVSVPQDHLSAYLN
jgi:hypothetical protein